MHRQLRIDRAFIATITTADGQQLTTTIYGYHVTDAEERYTREHPGSRATVRSELR